MLHGIRSTPFRGPCAESGIITRMVIRQSCIGDRIRFECVRQPVVAHIRVVFGFQLIIVIGVTVCLVCICIGIQLGFVFVRVLGQASVQFLPMRLSSPVIREMIIERTTLGRERSCPAGNLIVYCPVCIGFASGEEEPLGDRLTLVIDIETRGAVAADSHT